MAYKIIIRAIEEDGPSLNKIPYSICFQIMLLPIEKVIYFRYIGTALKWTMFCLYYNKLDDTADKKVGKSSLITRHMGP